MRQSLFRDGTFMSALAVSVFLVLGAASVPHLFLSKPSLAVGSASEAMGVHRFWSDNYKHHFYTISKEEKDFIIENDSNWKYEGVAYDAFVLDADNREALFRFYSPTYQGHFFTKSEVEKDFLIENDPNWNYEGVAFYTLGQVSGALPVYRFYSDTLRGHFYTTSDEERTRLIDDDPNWDYEGIAFYTPREGVSTPTPEVDPDPVVDPVVDPKEDVDPICGNSIVERGEQCDDGNLLDGDDCDAQCTLESEEAFNLITVRARGVVGNEEIELRIGEEVLQQWVISAEYEDYSYQMTTPLDADFIEVHFVSEGVAEQDVIVDYIRIDDDVFQTEDAIVESYGSWDVGSQCAIGFKESETLHCQGGWFRYSLNDSGIACGNSIVEIGEQCDDGNLLGGDGCSMQCEIEVPQGEGIPRVVTVRARGVVGNEEIELRIGDQTLQSWIVTTQDADYSYTLSNGLDQNFVEVHFVSEGVAEQDVIVDYIRIDDDLYQTDHSSVESYGSWDVATQCAIGFKSSEVLNCQGGWFRYDVTASNWMCGNAVIETGEQCDDGNEVVGDGCSSQCAVEPGTPQTPSNLTVTEFGDDFISFEWDEVGDAQGYDVIRDNEYLATVTDSRSYRDEDVVLGGVYEYQVTAFKDGLYSPPTQSVSATSREPDRTTPPTDLSYLPAAVQDYSIAFYDEFGGSGLNIDKWNTAFIWGSGLIINQEEQHYIDVFGDEGDFGVTPFSFTGDALVISAKSTPPSLLERTNNQPYTSGIITSRDSFNFTHGYAEARVKIPKGQGLWPAFWLLNTQYVDMKPEIDIMENLGGNTNQIHQTYHYYDENDDLVSQPSHVNGDDFSADYHVYSAHWEPGFIQYYIDGVPHHRVESGVASQDMYILANLAVGGSWGGSPNAETVFPAEYMIDYIRVYRQ